MITNVNLKNFKGFEQEDFNLKPLTLLTGINGMGKSSLIQSLLLLKQSFANTYLQTQQKVVLDNNSFVDLENCEALTNQKAAAPAQVLIELTDSESGTHKWTIDTSVPDATEPPFVYEGNKNYPADALFRNSFIYLTAERIGPRKSYTISSKTKTFNTVLGIQGELTPAYIQQAISQNQEIGIEKLIHPSLLTTKDKSINPQGLYENLNAWFTDILGRTVTAKVSSIDKDNVRLTYSIKGAQGENFSALQVGFGFSFSLPVVLAPLIARPGDLLIIENPEAHLHPSAQSKIGKLLALAAQNGVQVIIETHSDHVLNGIRVAVKEQMISPENIKLMFFGSSDSNNYIKAEPQIDKDGRIDEWPKDFFDTWEYALMELL